MRLHLIRLIITATIIAVLYIFLFQSMRCDEVSGRISHFMHSEPQVPVGDDDMTPLINVIDNLVEDAKNGAKAIEDHQQKKFEATQDVLSSPDPNSEPTTPWMAE